MLQPGTIISDRYVIVRLIGEGGMGSVYEAKHINIGKRIAVKLLNKEFSEDKEALERFHQEAQIAGKIDHLNICEVMDFGVTDEGLPFLVMEYLDGESLSDILKREKSLPGDVALGILAQILDALNEVHSKGIVHRDLKPENVFVTNVKGHGLVVKVLDFGISKIVKPGADSMRLTKTGTMIGTPYYMSPEQIRGSKDIDYRTDLYSCGVILYEMVTGRVPFSGESFNEVLAHILEDSLPDPKKIVPDLPVGIVKLLRKSMEKVPSKRPKTASIFMEESKALQVGIGDGKIACIPSTKMASMVGVPSVITDKTKGLKIAALGGIFVVLLLITIGIVFLVSSMKEKTTDDSSTFPIENKIKPAIATMPAGEKVPSQPAFEPELEKVRIELLNVPKNVRLIYEDKVVEGNVLEVEKSSKPILFTITAKGYKKRDIEIVPSEDLILDGTLTPVTPKEAIKEAVKDKTDKKETPPEVKKKKKKKMEQVWDLYPGK